MSLIDHLEPSLVLCLPVFLFLMLFLSVCRSKRYKDSFNQTTDSLAMLAKDSNLEISMQRMLFKVAEEVEAFAYALYVFDATNGQYVLKAVRHQGENNGQVGPSYGGLTPYRKETYVPPLSVSADSVPSKLQIVKEGEVPLFTIPIGQNVAAIRLGPVKRIPRRSRNRLKQLTSTFGLILENQIAKEQLQLKTEIVTTSEQALRSLFGLALNMETIVQKVLTMCLTSLSVEDGLAFVQEHGTTRIAAIQGWSNEQLEVLREHRIQELLWSLAGDRPTTIQNGDRRFETLPPTLQTAEPVKYVLVRFPIEQKEILLVIQVKLLQTEISDSSILTIIRTLQAGMDSMLRLQNRIQPVTGSFTDLMKQLSRTIDELNPYTVGYSELMCRFSIVIAQEMGIDPIHIEDIALAAYLSNIGVIGLSEDVYLKEGKFSDTEFEKMKLHADVGATIVEMMLGNKRVADMIRYHHERMDGNGYPKGLRGTEIPIGARILAVAQTFLAKINGRKYRTALSFDQALKTIQTAAGNQLDTHAVNALLGWFEKKRSAALQSKRSLGPCWEMCCAPPEVCATCPAFQQTQKNCWEFANNGCASHGKSCETCFVKTEYIGRQSK